MRNRTRLLKSYNGKHLSDALKRQKRKWYLEANSSLSQTKISTNKTSTRIKPKATNDFGDETFLNSDDEICKVKYAYSEQTENNDEREDIEMRGRRLRNS